MKHVAACWLSLACVAVLLAGQEAPSYQALQKKHQGLIEEYQKALREATTAKAREKLTREHRLALRRLAGQFLDLAARDKEPVNALIWVAANCPPDPSAREDLRGSALEKLGTRHLASDPIGPLCTRLVQDLDEASETFLRRVLEGSKEHGVQARACMSLALNLKLRARTIKSLAEGGASSVQSHEAIWGKEALKALRARNPDRLLAESEKLLLRARKEFDDVKHPLHGSVAALAEVVLQTLRSPVLVDKPAPAINGEDLAGKALKLADFKGKVLLLDFGGRSFPPSQTALTVQRGLLKKFAGKPFAVASVNADTNREATRKALEKDGVNWPVWWDGGNVGGPIATRWDVELWPTVYLIDQKGIVRAFSVGWPSSAEVEKAVGELLNKGGK